MLEKAVVIYCICDEVWKVFGLEDDPQCKMSSPEIMTFSILSAQFHGCNYQQTRLISRSLRYFSHVLSLSQIVRRIHKIPYQIWMMVFAAFQLYLRDKKTNIFIVDSFPVAAYQNHKSFRAKIFNTKEFHGYTASKKMYFFGIKVHMIVDINGVPIEFMFTPGSMSDVSALEFFDMNLPPHSHVLGDRAYTNYHFEDMLLKLKQIHMIPKRKTAHRRQHSSEKLGLIKKHRNQIETVFSCIVSRMPRQIKARNEKGFCLKVLFLVLAYMVALYCRTI